MENPKRTIISLTKQLELQKQKLERLSIELSETKTTIDEKDHYIDILKRSLDKRAENFGLDVRGGEFLYDLTDLEQENEKCRETIADQAQKIEDLTEEVSELKESYNLLEQRSQEALDEAEETIKEEEKKRTDLYVEIENQKKLLQAASSSEETLKQEVSKGLKDAKELSAENEQLYSIQQELLTSLTELQDKFDELQWVSQKMTDFEQEKLVFAETIETLKSSNSKLLQSEEKLSSEVVDKTKKVKELSDKVSSISQVCTDFEQENAKLSESNLALTKELEELKAKYRDVSTTLSETKDSLVSAEDLAHKASELQDIAEAEADSLRGTNSAMKARIEELERLSAEQKKMIASYGDEIKSLCNAIAIVREKDGKEIQIDEREAVEALTGTDVDHSGVIDEFGGNGKVDLRASVQSFNETHIFNRDEHTSPKRKTATLPSVISQSISAKPVNSDKHAATDSTFKRPLDLDVPDSLQFEHLPFSEQVELLKSRLRVVEDEAEAVKRSRQVERRLLEQSLREVRESRIAQQQREEEERAELYYEQYGTEEEEDGEERDEEVEEEEEEEEQREEEEGEEEEVDGSAFRQRVDPSRDFQDPNDFDDDVDYDGYAPYDGQGADEPPVDGTLHESSLLDRSDFTGNPLYSGEKGKRIAITVENGHPKIRQQYSPHGSPSRVSRVNAESMQGPVELGSTGVGASFALSDLHSDAKNSMADTETLRKEIEEIRQRLREDKHL
ncbi:hypothetical protein ADUPG1_006040 [Aduncisulcus paluster]|uniref:Uncharacterized protein n=1 Tax=Aduncisulcus paluster TaxID=2918883 RepID=A0ABQ5KIB7_9EUKA|nr:hypothetical protein ADUPG1_006040 [Aduncisulcus paluster]